MKIGIVGLGIMGRALALRLKAEGQQVIVTNRTRSKAEDLLALGISFIETPAQLAAESEIVISIVTDNTAVQAVSAGPDGILAGLPSSSIYIDMSTIAPGEAAARAAYCRSNNHTFLQAPVMGSKKQIASGSLLILAGGSGSAIDSCEPIWKSISSKLWRFPEASQASTAKLACNMMIGHLIIGLGQSLLLAQKSGMDPALLLDILGSSALGCPMFASKGKSVLARQFDPNFIVRNLLKDLHLVSQAARELETPLPLHGVTRELFTSAVAQGLGDLDYSAVLQVMERMAGVELGHLD